MLWLDFDTRNMGFYQVRLAEIGSKFQMRTNSVSNGSLDLCGWDPVDRSGRLRSGSQTWWGEILTAGPIAPHAPLPFKFYI